MGAIGCNFGPFGWKLEADSDLLRNLLTKHHVLFQLAVAIRDALVGMAQVWPALRGPLISANEAGEVAEAFEKHAQAYAREFIPRLTEDILKLMHEPKFPERPHAQIKFLADSLAGRPNVEARTSRDICGEGRAKERAKSPHQIIRKEFYIECSCSYKGPALNDACRKCGAQISYLPEILSNT